MLESEAERRVAVDIAVYNSNSWTEAAEQPGTRTAKVATSGVLRLRNAKINSLIFFLLNSDANMEWPSKNFADGI